MKYPCLLWSGSISKNGYGSITIGGRTYHVHRLEYAAWYGSPGRLEVGHLCHDEDVLCPGGTSCLHRRCYEITHLAAMTRQQNALSGRTIVAEEARRTHCPSSHAYSLENTYIHGGRRYCRTCIRTRHRGARIMPFTGFSFDESVGQTEPGRPHVPEGYYLLEATKVEPTPEDYAKTVGVFLNWKISEAPEDAGGAGVGREFRDYCSLGAGVKNDRGTQFGLGQALGALGLASVAKKLPGTKIETYESFKGLCAGLTKYSTGKKVVALIADQPGNNGRPFSGIEEYLPADQWATLKKARTSPMRGPATSVASSNGAPVGAAPPAAAATLGAEIDAMFEGVG